MARIAGDGAGRKANKAYLLPSLISVRVKRSRNTPKARIIDGHLDFARCERVWGCRLLSPLPHQRRPHRTRDMAGGALEHVGRAAPAIVGYVDGQADFRRGPP